jgi:hypothetical protein|tara:strand:- start:95 stop:832 length:738 start_codon:yes stop_codon:yes gene_type:complete
MKKIGITFGGGGGFISYYCGIAKYIQKNYDTSNLYFAGSSAGVVSAFLLAINYDIDTAHKQFITPWFQIAKKNYWFAPNSIVSYDLFPTMYSLFKKMFYQKKFLKKIQHRLFIFTTNLDLTKKCFDTYHSMSDVRKIMCCSCALPGVFSSGIGLKYKHNTKFMDGSFPTGVSCLTPNNDINWIPISLTLLGVSDPNFFLLPATLLTWVIADPNINDYLYHLGYQHASKIDLSQIKHLKIQNKFDK